MEISTIVRYSWEIATVIFGLIMCFSGFRLFKFSITVAGIVIGYGAGTYILSVLSDVTKTTLPLWALLAIPFVFAGVFGALAFSFYKKAFIFVVAVFVARSVYVFVKDTAVVPIHAIKDTLIVMGISIVIGIAVGFAAFLVQKGAIIVFTAFGGAYLISSQLSSYAGKIGAILDTSTKVTDKLFKTDVKPLWAFSGLLILILGVAGIVTQAKKKS